MYYKCEEPERWAAQEARRNLEQELKERRELARLREKYPDA